MLINCENTANRILSEVKEQTIELKAEGIEPCIALLRVKGNDASEVYVKNKVKRCEDVGIKSIVVELENDIDEEDLLFEIKVLNNSIDVHGILVQLPLPEHIDEKKIVNAIHPAKDVDCLSIPNIGSLYTNEDITVPCTPLGIMEILKDNDIKLEGKNVLVINRSALVGKPLIELLQRENATVTLAHSKTNRSYLLDYMALADVIITATGQADFINTGIMMEVLTEFKKYKKQNKLTIIDVSMNRDENGKLCGDVSKELYDYEDLLITPVPKGVGLTTVAALLKNVILCCNYSNVLF